MKERHKSTTAVSAAGRLLDDDQRDRYLADKLKSFPPDIEREPGSSYAYKV